MNKVLIILSFFALLICCDNSGRKEKKQTDLASQISHVINNGILQEVVTSVHFNNYENNPQIIIEVPFKYSHAAWSKLAGEIVIYEISKNNLTKEILSKYGNPIILSIEYQIENSKIKSAIYEVVVNKNLVSKIGNKVYRNKTRERFIKYIYSQMTPSDFQAYDYALQEKLFKKFDQNEAFNTSFMDFILEASYDEDLVTQEKFVLEKLIDWTYTRGDIETPKHFEFFMSNLQEVEPVDLPPPNRNDK